VTTVLETTVAATSDSPAPAVDTKHPIGFWFFFWGEFAERCSFYGMRAILPLYLTSRLAMPDDQASEWYSWFKAACYFLPLLGGFLADRWLGKYWTIVGFSVPYVIGQILIGIETRVTLIVALVLLACGSGVIKPNISSLMGMTYDQQRPGNTRLRTSAFLWFYFSINVGSTLSMLALPIIRDRVGYRTAFLIPAVFMVIALTVFAAGKGHYAIESTAERAKSSWSQRWQQLAPLMCIFVLLVFFWIAYEHNDSLWVYFARDHVNRHLPTFLGGAELAADQFQFINAALILLFIPSSQWFWPRVDPTGLRFPHTTKSSSRSGRPVSTARRANWRRSVDRPGGAS
jgi:POT family proton-dependent oligopeptide transporter